MDVMLLVALMLASTLGPQAQSRAVQYELRTGTSVGEPVILEVIVQNDGSARAVVDVDFGASNVEFLTFEITNPKGGRTKVRPPLGTGFQVWGRYQLSAGQRQVVTLALNEFADFSAPGNYQVAVTFTGPALSGGTALGIARNASWTFTLGSRDAAAIQRRCDELLARIQKRDDDTRDALIALTAIRDPAAVPYLLKSAEARGLATEEIKALERIGGGDAKAALQVLAKSPNRFTAVEAKAALARVK